ncbi:MAG: porin family protein [Cyclobacteriaceae bacterium]|nr:porin family protein [Cyclobacteriaceae bacterium]
MNIKTSASLIAICCALTIGAQAQVSVGAKAGLNVYDNYQTGTKYYTSSPGLGFHLGAYGDYDLSELLVNNLHVKVEALLSTRGANLSEFTSNGDKIDHDRQSIYIDIPTALTYNIGDKFNLEGGVVTSLFLNEYRSITKDQQGFKIDEGDQFRTYERLQFGFLAGATYEFMLFDQTFVGGLRYNMALTPAFESIRDSRASRAPMYMMLQASLAYRIFDF